MSTSKATTSSKPKYLSLDAAHDLIPKLWVKNLKRLESLMHEIPEVSGHIEDLRQFTSHMSTHVPNYDNNLKEVIRASLFTLTALQKQFHQQVVKSKAKPAQGPSVGSQVGGEGVRWSQQQMEKAAARGDKGDKVRTMGT
ncbi:hypothetical protein PISMIDRAFT_17000 [Pisolithus microcarpus 441]|uniref:Uncharacterized protein n=1 Tax=Pisolithus microcarpus 441 TaxID=765257 RepID=A0A0C9XR86_9AGAM|nr:hypothetical protein PISMIDRAFT_17000 [Pisolithus microcarpus 441]